MSNRQVRYLSEPKEDGKSFEDLSKTKNILQKVVIKMADKIVARMYPRDPEDLKNVLWGGIDEDNFFSKIAEATRKAPQRCIQRRKLKAMIAGHVRGNVLFELFNPGRREANSIHAHDRSEIKRNETPKEGKEEATEANDDDVLVSGSNKQTTAKRRRINGGFSRAMSLTRKDWVTLVTTGMLDTIVSSRICISDTYLKEVSLHFARRTCSIDVMGYQEASMQ